MKAKSILVTLFNFVLAFTLLSIANAPHLVAVGVSAFVAYQFNVIPAFKNSLFNGFVTNGYEFKGKEMEDIVLRPIFNGTLPNEMGIRIITEVKSKTKLTFFGPTSKILKAYADGWTGGSASTKKQKELILAEFKAENSYSKQEYKDTVIENLTQKTGDNDISGTAVMKAELELFMSGIKEDVRRNFWLADTAKKSVATVSSTQVYQSTADANYNVINGIWKALIGDAVAYASATNDDVRRITISNGAVAQVVTHTLTGTSGTANITINGETYLATFATSLTVTAANFVTTHSTALAAIGITVTSSTANVILTSTIAGAAFVSTATAANVSGDLAGTVVQTTANTAPSALTTDEAKATFKSMYENSNKVLKSMYASKQVRFYATDSMIENYMTTLEATGTEAAHKALVDGIERLTYRGIPIIPMDIDQHLEADFVNAYPHRAILTLPNNLCLVLNSRTDFAETQVWFEKKDNLNMIRSQFEFGANYILPELVTVAY